MLFHTPQLASENSVIARHARVANIHPREWFIPFKTEMCDNHLPVDHTEMENEEGFRDESTGEMVQEVEKRDRVEDDEEETQESVKRVRVEPSATLVNDVE
jgi:hypothetical protein